MNSSDCIPYTLIKASECILRAKGLKHDSKAIGSTRIHYFMICLGKGWVTLEFDKQNGIWRKVRQEFSVNL